MFFRKRDEPIKVEPLKNNEWKGNAPDYDAIKNAMEEQPTMRQSTKYNDYPTPKTRTFITEEKPVYEETYTETPGAPLFVKVDKYRDVLRDVHELKLYTAGIKQVLDLLHDIETIRMDANKVLRATVQRIEKSLVEMDSELLRPRGAIMSEITREDTEVRHIEGSLTELQKQLSDLKRELQTFK
ncbi:MAG: hypothetical protein HY513_02595 [Candidatus Aenigmarchaeota archaeon]|nr:hypothetical protein [Candidatus Aenigmarchaeota archaeon]